MAFFKPLLALFFVLLAIIPNPISANNSGNNLAANDAIVSFNLNYLHNKSMTSEDWAVMYSWQKSIRKAPSILPSRFVEEISVIDRYDSGCSNKLISGTGGKCLRKIKFSFFVDSQTWVTGHPGEINLRPSAIGVPDWMVWEPLSKDGFTEEERLWVILHEFAHSYDLSLGVIWKAYNKISEPSVTLYGCVGGRDEDFGDTFSLYVMFPEQLKKFPEHYEMIKNILGREYSDYYKMPNSVRSKLVDPNVGCGDSMYVRDYSR